MSLDISDAGVTVQITRETRAPSRQGFGSLLFLNPVVDVTTRYAKYTSLASVAAVYDAEDEPYKAALAYYSQSPSPTSFIVGGVLEGTALVPAVAAFATITYTGTATDTLSSDITIDGESYSATSITSGVTSGSEVATELSGLINANGSSVFVGSFSGDVLTITQKVKGVAGNASIAADVQTTGGINSILVQFSGGTDTVPATSGENLANALDDILTEGDFYAVMPTAHFNDVEADIVSIAGWTEANNRLLFNTTHNAATKQINDTTSIAYVLQQAGYDRTVNIYTEFIGSYPNASAFAILATVSYSGTDTVKTLKFKDLPGITVSNLNSNELNIINGKNTNAFYETASIRMFDDGITSGGSWVDDIAGMDALAEEIRVNVFGLLSRIATKVPYNEKGMSLLEAEVEAGLSRFELNGFLTQRVDDNGDYLAAYTVSHIPVIQASVADKAARIAPDINFTARIAGAVHDILVSGTLVLE